MGDSITRGRSSSPWLPLVGAALPPGSATTNAGVDGDRVSSALRRLPRRALGEATHVVVLLGTNDILRQLSNARRRGRFVKRTGRAVFEQAFRRDLTELVRRLRHESTAAVAVGSLPPVGEHGSDDAARAVSAVNAVIRAVCGDAGVTVLPLHERLVALRQRYASAAGPSFCGSRMMMRAAVRRRILRWSFTQCAVAEGFVALSDGIHLSESGARELAALVSGWVSESAAERAGDATE
ncbi:SGNH/GDSL hydrolase family protein [Rathayibacter iranicus]|uniref:SGNH/GDSL hydrolase family protein n=1 Tax=Rathayibacter iranicus TaxID=59737 RepID=UPI0013256BE4|nr:SGNH/GDSL hydrolase family protein [Rathayibacter iranicus]MWV31978.1 hypothetical protein [Rathayibacter iranicus NCPPB 2253 = VKM Ac-1602]